VETKRPYGSGYLKETAEGSNRWRLRIDLGPDPVTGKRRRRMWTFEAKGLKMANRKASQLLAALELEEPSGTQMSVAKFFAEYMVFSASRGRAPTTLHHYQLAFDGFFSSAIGAIPLASLTTHHLDSLYAAAMQRPKPLSPATVKKYHAVISAALNQAVRWKWLSTNPALHVTLPTATIKELEVPTPDEVRRLIVAANERSALLGAFVLVAAVTGCRRGELAALQWKHLDGDSLLINSSAYAVGGVRGVKSTKSGRERRVNVDAPLLEFLKQWRERCEALASEFGVDYSDACFIFSSRPDGASPVNVDTMSTAFVRIARSCELPHVHLHSLRHFAATELISSGIDPRAAATRLGHANPALTLQVYAHATNERLRHAASIGSRVLEGLPTPE